MLRSILSRWCEFKPKGLSVIQTLAVYLYYRLMLSTNGEALVASETRLKLIDRCFMRKGKAIRAGKGSDTMTPITSLPAHLCRVPSPKSQVDGVCLSDAKFDGGRDLDLLQVEMRRCEIREREREREGEER
jgi:hypothetical protein